MKKKIEKAPAWAYELDGELCHWAEPDRDLAIRLRPSPYHKVVPVYIVRRSDLRKKKKK